VRRGRHRQGTVGHTAATTSQGIPGVNPRGAAVGVCAALHQAVPASSASWVRTARWGCPSPAPQIHVGPLPGRSPGPRGRARRVNHSLVPGTAADQGERGARRSIDAEDPAAAHDRQAPRDPQPPTTTDGTCPDRSPSAEDQQSNQPHADPPVTRRTNQTSGPGRRAQTEERVGPTAAEQAQRAVRAVRVARHR